MTTRHWRRGGSVSGNKSTWPMPTTATSGIHSLSWDIVAVTAPMADIAAALYSPKQGLV